MIHLDEAGVPAWHSEALCAKIGPVFIDDLTLGEQRRTCRGCPVRLPCVEQGMAQGGREVRWGVQHGGISPRRLAEAWAAGMSPAEAIDAYGYDPDPDDNNR